MPAWLNQVTIAAPRNGTTAHTVDPASGSVVSGSNFTPTAGRFLLCLVEGAVTSTTPTATGYSLPARASAINNSGLYAFIKASASGGGGDTVTTTHNGSNYTVVFSFFEFPSGTTWVDAATAIGQTKTAANPTLSGLTGSNTVMGAAAQDPGVAASTSATWGSPDTEIVDAFAVKATTDGNWLGIAYQDAYVSASYAPTPTITSASATTTERLTFAVNPPTGGPSVSSTMAVASKASVTCTASKGSSGTISVTSRAATAVTGQRSVSSTLTASARTSVTLTGRKGATGTLSTSARAAVQFTGSTGAPAVTSTITVTARTATAFTGRKSASGTLVAGARGSVSFQGQKTALGSLTVTGRASVAIGGSIVFAKSSTMSATARAAFIAAAGPKDVRGTFTPSARVNLTAAGRKATTGQLLVAGRALVLVSGRRVATGTFTVRARAAITVTGMVGSPPDSTYDRVPGATYGAGHSSEYADAVGADPRISTYGG